VFCVTANQNPIEIAGTKQIIEYMHALAMVIDKKNQIISCQESRGMGIPVPLRHALQKHFPHCAIVLHHIPQQAKGEGTCAYHALYNLGRLAHGSFPTISSKGTESWWRNLADIFNTISVDERHVLGTVS
jgi:hypothetical protein